MCMSCSGHPDCASCISGHYLYSDCRAGRAPGSHPETPDLLAIYKKALRSCGCFRTELYGELHHHYQDGRCSAGSQNRSNRKSSRSDRAPAFAGLATGSAAVRGTRDVYQSSVSGPSVFFPGMHCYRRSCGVPAGRQAGRVCISPHDRSGLSRDKIRPRVSMLRI